jgi:transcriptional regulator with XRE-family HTH domain
MQTVRAVPRRGASRLGRRIKALRLKRGLSLRDLERITKIHRGHLSSYENSRHEPSGIRILARIATALETTLDELAGRKTAKPRDAAGT